MDTFKREGFVGSTFDNVMIQPTIGRVLWFTPASGSEKQRDDKQPLAALVTYVWNDRMVNLAAFDQDGNSFSATSVTLLQGDDAKPEHGYFASWMPFQKGQAAKQA